MLFEIVLLLFLTKELRLCHQGQESALKHTLTLSGVRGTGIVDRTHVLVVERFSSSKSFKIPSPKELLSQISLSEARLRRTGSFGEFLGFPIRARTEKDLASVERNFAANCLETTDVFEEILAINPM